jgi:uncharacterized protein (DUF58 family)
MNWDDHPRLKLGWRNFLLVVFSMIVFSLGWTLYYEQSRTRWLLLSILTVLICSFTRSLIRRYIQGDRSRTITRLTLEGRFLVFALLVFGFLGMNTGANLIYLGFGSLISTYVFSRIATEFGLRGLKVRRVVPASVTCGEECRIEIWLRNERRSTKQYGLVVEEDLEEKTGIFFPSVGPGQTVGGSFTLTFEKRGEAKLKQLTVRSSFPLGLVEKVSQVEFEATILVLPKIYPLASRVLDDIKSSGSQQGRPSMLGPERWDMIRNLRDYRPGDQLRNVHWKSSARRNQLTVKEYERPRPQRLLFILFGPKELDDDAWEAAVTLTASFLEGFHQAQESVALVTCLEDRVETLELGDSVGMQNAMELLALAQPGGEIGAILNASRHIMDGRQPVLVSGAPIGHKDIQRLRAGLGAPHLCSTAQGLGRYLGEAL